MFWWTGLTVWVALGLLGIVWMPRAHSSWGLGGRIVMWAILVTMLAVLGPFGLWQMVRLDRQERPSMGDDTC